MMRSLCWLPVVLALAAWEPLSSPDPDVTAGNEAYAAGRWDDAIAAYERARGSGVDEAGLAYNLGTARLRKAEAGAPEARGDLVERGLADLRAGGDLEGSGLRAQALYNTGNAQRAAGQLDEAIDSYKQAARQPGARRRAGQPPS
ncbi:MAG: tetratricopeptide repeat protein [Kofleriaceae bacterium]